MKKRFSPPFLLSLSGLLLFGLAFWRLQLEEKPTQDEKPLARVENAYGSTFLDRKGHRESLRERQLLQRLDLIETRADSETLLAFANGEEVRLLENSVALVDLEAGRPVVILKDGDVWAEKAKDGPGSILISRNGIRRSLASDFQERAQRQAQTMPTAETPTPKAPAPQMIRAEARTKELVPQPALRIESLTADYIQDTLRSQRNLFFKCYTQLLQKAPGLSGDAAVAFTIEKNGRVREAEVSTSNLQDPAFKRCLSDAMKRVEFKSFAGDPVNALFPIRFE
ncbi:MAG TPA: AgmX/PglI C-terminal domain-containing protein [Pseudobdellovibrionaceae bacterium]|nr:AgmX/PglI C-terminal domain-containing protein [Pseudobdellovibrionaceae bacterium]